MKPLSTDKYNVAWFKLAEFVSRGEKERALGLFKLLMYSINNQALGYQLKGDLLLSFEDPEAITCYQKAAQIYMEEQKLPQAAAIYEHLLFVSPESISTLEKLIEIYGLLGNQERSSFYFKEYFCLLLKNNLFEHAITTLSHTSQSISNDTRITLYHDLITAALISQTISPSTMKPWIADTIELTCRSKQPQKLTALLTTIETYQPSLHTEILTIIKKKL